MPRRPKTSNGPTTATAGVWIKVDSWQVIICLGVSYCCNLVSMCEQIIVGPHGVPHPPSLAQMTFTSMSELKFDSAALPGDQI